MRTIEKNRNAALEIVPLVIAAQEGRSEALNELFVRFDRTVFCVAFKRLKNESDAEEVRQDVFIQVMAKIGQLENPACFAGWLRQIASRMALNKAIRSRSFMSLDGVEWEPASEDSTPFGEVLNQERAEQVRIGMAGLPEVDRKTLEAFYFEGRSIKEMADEFNAPVGTIKRRLHTARHRLAEKLEAFVSA
jgi:RNA polymerase sigma-70 factor, ECF subfamily